MTERYFAVVPAAGVGQRMGSDIPKQYLTLLGKTVIEHTIATLLAEPLIERIVIATSAEDSRCRSLALLENDRIDIVDGGAELSDSVLYGLKHLAAFADNND